MKSARQLYLLHLCTVSAFCVWTGILAGLYHWSMSAESEHHEKLIELKAVSLADQAQLLRRWIGGHGGVYVEQGDDIVPNPLLKHLPHRDIVLGERKLTLYNSPMVLRMLFSEFSGTSEHRIRLVAHQPLSPEGKPDSWEKSSLYALQGGETSVREKVHKEDKTLYRLMYPIKNQPKCDRCHNFGDTRPSEVVGGLSIVVDRTHTDAKFQVLAARIGTNHFVIWSFGALALLLFDRVGSRLLRRIEYTATYDHLTQIFNRRTIEQSLEYGIKVANRYNQPLSILLLDVDRFKSINDSYGHHGGDKILREITHVLTQSVRDTDTVGRFGGEEFLIVAPNTNEDAALTLAERILAELRSHDIWLKHEQKVSVTASIGIASLCEDDEGDTPLLQRADRALYQAKDLGRDQVCVAGQP